MNNKNVHLVVRFKFINTLPISIPKTGVMITVINGYYMKPTHKLLLMQEENEHERTILEDVVWNKDLSD